MVVSLLGKFLSLTASYMYCGTVSRFLRQTPLFDFIKANVAKAFSPESFLNSDSSVSLGKAGLKGLLHSYIMENDNSEVYKLFGVLDFSDYLASYIANTAINVISITVIYFSVSVITGTMLKAAKILIKLPVIKQVNVVINVLAGFLQGTVVIWIFMVILMFFVLQGMFLNVYEALLSSKVAVSFLKYNILAKIIFRVMP